MVTSQLIEALRVDLEKNGEAEVYANGAEEMPSPVIAIAAMTRRRRASADINQDGRAISILTESWRVA